MMSSYNTLEHPQLVIYSLPTGTSRDFPSLSFYELKYPD